MKQRMTDLFKFIPRENETKNIYTTQHLILIVLNFIYMEARRSLISATEKKVSVG